MGVFFINVDFWELGLKCHQLSHDVDVNDLDSILIIHSSAWIAYIDIFNQINV